MWFPSIELNQPGANALLLAIEQAIQCGELAVGERLPPQRILAYRLNINPTTVARAYRKAAQQGLIGGQIGRGTYVLGHSSAGLFPKAMGYSNSRLDFSVTRLRCDDQLLAINQQIAERDPLLGSAAQFEYLTERLLQRFQRAICQWLERQRGLVVSAEQVIATASCQYALQFVFQRLCQPGDGLLVDSYTAPGVISAANRAQLRLFCCPSDEQGITAEGLEAAAKQTGAKAVLLIPSHHSPMGISMDLTRRQALAATIDRLGLTLIEDDIYGVFGAAEPIFSLLKAANALLLGGFSKCLSAGHRAAYLVTRGSIAQRLSDRVIETAWLVSSAAVSHLSCAIEQQLADAAVEHCVQQLKWRNSQLAKRLSLPLAGTSPHHWLSGSHFDLAAIQQTGLELAGGENFRVLGDVDEQFARLSILGAEPEQFTQALEILARYRIL